MTPTEAHGTGWVEVIAGCMFSGKTEELIRRLRRTLYAKQTVVAVKPVIDDRYDAEDLASHDGVTIKAVPVAKAEDIWDVVKDADVVGIDEAQFFENLSDVVQRLASDGKRVIVAGLDMDYRGIPFGPIPNLLATAEKVVKLNAVCMTCGGRATRSQRIVDSDEQVVVGSTEAYEARCRRHWSPQPVFAASHQMDRED